MSGLVNFQDEAYNKIKQMILTLEIKPGARVNKKELEQQLAIGTTPLREAIIRLQKEGLFNVVAQSGTYVAKINLDEVYQARFVRENIEKLVCVEACDLVTPAQTKELKKILKLQKVYLQTGDYENFFELDETFHHFFYQVCHKEFIWQWLQPLNIQFKRFRILRLEVEALNWDTILKQHTEIVKLFTAKDKAALEQVVVAHLHMLDQDALAVTKAYPDYFN